MSNPVARQLCAVCQELTENHHIHYGALCCFSCRAFFRRANQTTSKNTAYSCKQDGHCNISLKNRKKCQKCRYDACLSAGMDPALVLTDEQKKARFRKKSERRNDAKLREDPGPQPQPRPQGRNQVVRRKRKAPALTGPTTNEGGSETLELQNPFDAFEMILQQSSSFSNQLQSGTLKEVEETLALAQEIHFQNNSSYSGKNPELLLSSVERQRQHSSGGNLVASHYQQSGLHFPNISTGKFLNQDKYKEWPDFTLNSNPAQQLSLDFFPDQSFMSQASSSAFFMKVLEEASKNFTLDIPSTMIDSSFEPKDQDQINLSGIQNTTLANDDYIAKIISDYEENICPQEDLFRRLVSFHCGTIHFSAYDFGRTVSQLCERFRQFAVKRPEFQRLSLIDQAEVLKLNQPLFSHYLLARYITASSGVEQIECLIGPTKKLQADPYWIRFLSSVELVSIKVLSKDVGIFSDSGPMKRYFEVASRWLSRLCLTPQHNGLIAAIILLSSNPQSAFSSPSILEDEMTNLKSVLKNSSFSAKMSGFERDVDLLISELLELQQIFTSQNVKSITSEALQSFWGALGGSKDFVPLAKELEMPFTREEEDWLAVQLFKYMSAYQDVPMGEDFVNEFIMFSYDVPLSKHFGFKKYATFTERFRRVLKTQPGFNDLTDRDQTLVWRQGCAKAVACCSAKSEHCLTGNDQLQFLFGELDKNIWQKNYEHQVSVTKINKIRKIMMTDINKVSAHFDSGELMDYLRLVGTLGEVTSNNQFFPIFTLIALLSGEGLSSEAARFVTDTRNKYFTLLGRKLSSNRRTYNTICMGLNGIDELAVLMKKLET